MRGTASSVRDSCERSRSLRRISPLLSLFRLATRLPCLPRLPRATYAKGSSGGEYSARGHSFIPSAAERPLSPRITVHSQLCFPVSPLESALLSFSVSVHSRRLPEKLSLLESALPKNTGGLTPRPNRSGSFDPAKEDPSLITGHQSPVIRLGVYCHFSLMTKP